MNELLDCPFCPDGGSPAVVHHQSQHHGAKGVYFKDRGYSVKCGDCDALLGTDNRCDEYGDTDGNFGSEEEATEAWNTRSYKPELLAELEKREVVEARQRAELEAKISELQAGRDRLVEILRMDCERTK